MKKSNKIGIVILLVLAIPIGFVGGFLITGINNTSDLIIYEPMDIGPSIRSTELPMRAAGSNQFLADDLDTGLRPSQSSMNGYYDIGDHLEWLVLDDYTGEVFLSSFELKAVGDLAEIWLQDDLAYLDNRDTPVVTETQISYFLEEFETKIYSKTTEYFGIPDFHDGSDPDLVEDGIVPEGHYFQQEGRNVILLSNIRDEMFYDDKYPYYIVGYYWSYLERMHDRNIVTIDVHDWENRVGDDAARPNLYESVLAHEYQHLIHDDYNPYDDTFMNEGCSMYAEPLCGYPIDYGSINSFLFTPDNSLTEWGDQGDINILADYGQALLWTIYLSDHYGGHELISYFVQAGVAGIEGINNALAHFGYIETFDDIFHDWRIANILHTDEIGDGKYNYESIDLGGAEAISTRVYNIKSAKIPPKLGSDFGLTKTILNYNTHTSLLGAFGTDYFKFSNLTAVNCDGSKIFDLEFLFDGDDKAIVPTWIREDQDSNGDLEWYSTSAKPESDLALYCSISVPNEAEITLSFDTYYQIEALWDYGFVQVSTDDGETWISLANEYTTTDHDPDAYPTIIDSLPGLTGSSEGWVNMEFDLTEYAGEQIIICFRYMTDWGTEDLGWYLDNVKINDILLDDADEEVSFSVPEAPEIDFIVTLLGVDVDDEHIEYTMIETMLLNDLAETGSVEIEDYVSDDGYILVIVSPTKGPADYLFEVTRFPK